MIADTSPCSTPSPSADSPTEGCPLAVLVADDNVTNRTLVSKLLASAGHRVEAVSTAEAALDALARGSFDAAILESDLPGMSGLDCAKLHRLAFVGRRRIPIVIMTAHASPEVLAGHEAAGIDRWLAKPVQPRELLDLVAGITSTAEAAPLPIEDETVKTLSGHPRFRPASTLDARTLSDLLALGGIAFVSELVEGFLSDTDEVLSALRAAVGASDVETFRDQLHALRSGAANIGAQEIYALCLTWRQIEAGEIATRGAAHVDRLAAELDRARADLRQHLAEVRSGEQPPADTVQPRARVAT